MPIFSPPLIPDSDEARQWAREELQRGVYSTTPSLWEWIKEHVRQLIDAITSLGSGWDGAFVPLMTVAIIAGVMILAFLYGGPVRRQRSRPTPEPHLWAGDDSRTAAQLRQAARRAAEDGDYRLAVLEQFRAVVRLLEERAVIETTQGMTAGEVGRAMSEIFPDEAATIQRAAQTFSRTLYGGAGASPEDYAALCLLDSTLEAAPPATKVEG